MGALAGLLSQQLSGRVALTALRRSTADSKRACSNRPCLLRQLPFKIANGCACIHQFARDIRLASANLWRANTELAWPEYRRHQGDVCPVGLRACFLSSLLGKPKPS